MNQSKASIPHEKKSDCQCVSEITRREQDRKDKIVQNITAAVFLIIFTLIYYLSQQKC